MTTADLVANAKNLNFAFVDPASTSGCLIPGAGLAKFGITDPKTQFKNVVYAGGHDTAILSVVQGKTDAAGIGRNPGGSWDPVVALEKSGTIPKDDLRYLWQSDPIPPTPFQIRGDLDPALGAKVKDAILNMKTRDFKAYLEYNSTAKPDDNTSFISVSDQDYAQLTQLARDAGMIK
jgi:phosphonate transport system substrate-binding protein